MLTSLETDIAALINSFTWAEWIEIAFNDHFLEYTTIEEYDHLWVSKEEKTVGIAAQTAWTLAAYSKPKYVRGTASTLSKLIKSFLPENPSTVDRAGPLENVEERIQRLLQGHTRTFLSLQYTRTVAIDDTRDWCGEKDISEAIAAGRMWEVQYYPKTPIGFTYMKSARLNRALAWVIADNDPTAVALRNE